MIDLRLETEATRAITYMHMSSSFLISLKLAVFMFKFTATNLLIQ